MSGEQALGRCYFPFSRWEKEGPAAKRWEDEGRLVQNWPPLAPHPFAQGRRLRRRALKPSPIGRGFVLMRSLN